MKAFLVTDNHIGPVSALEQVDHLAPCPEQVVEYEAAAARRPKAGDGRRPRVPLPGSRLRQPFPTRALLGVVVSGFTGAGLSRPLLVA